MNTQDFYIGKQFNFLKSMSFAEKEVLLNHSSKLEIKKGEVIFFEDEHLKKLYCISNGACKFSLIDNKGKEHITKLLGEGDLMGRRSIITNKGALVTATAITNTILYSIDKDPVLLSLEKNNEFCQDVLKGFIDDMEDDAKKITYFQNNKKLKVRLAGLLLYLAHKFGTEKKGWINISLRRQDMADILGTTSEYVISLLTSFKNKNYLELNRGNIKINSNQKLITLMNSN
ncbi:Crp/Fnr family transcriptional regulator [Psychroserpens sp.]|uniref:Crp/Fnr family transcriptional regulator n=1 Tax=Psychroserpens sp. TaxID=2020870 RepID=UPI00385B0A00